MSEELAENQGQTSDVDVEALLSEVNAPEPERAMSQPESAVPQPDAATKETPVPASPTQVPSEFDFDWNGKKIKAPLEKFRKWAQMGYDYGQRIEALKLEKEQLRREYEEKYKPFEKYRPIDEYAQKDPEWWKFVEEQYNNRLASQDPVVQRVKGLLDEELKPVRAIISDQEKAAEQAKVQKEDQALQQDIESIRKEFSDLDFDTPDESGKSLFVKVLEHANQHGFPSFRGAFRDFYHDQLVLRYEARGREAVTKESQQRQKLGLSPQKTPSKKPTDDFDVKGKSYNQIMDEITERYAL